MKKPLIYVAGPYTKPDPVENTRNAILFGQRLRDELGVSVIVPHLSHFEHLIRPRPYAYWLEIDFELIDHCDGLYRMPGESNGADEEVLYAKKLGIPVFRTVEQLDFWIAETERDKKTKVTQCTKTQWKPRMPMLARLLKVFTSLFL